MAALLDTNVLVYRFDPRDPEKQERAKNLVRKGLVDGDLRIPHQAVIEFVAATTRPLPKGGSLLTPEEARRESEELILQFPILYPDDALLRLALRGWASYGFSWFDAHLWAYAEHFGLTTLYSEDFQTGRVYGNVRIEDPFA
jgi:predicted nucleic acid-binding protein